MKVLNSSTIKKTLKVGKLSVSFPPGISEKPETRQILRYISIHPDLSIYTEIEKKVDDVKIEEKEPVNKQRESKRYKSKEVYKKGAEESSKEEE